MASYQHMLQVVDWRAIQPDAADSADLSLVPSAIRRRAPRFELYALSCSVPIMTDTSEIVFCSRYGNQATAAEMLQALACSDLLSPTSFSHSVHNAVPGLTAQACGARASHTAVAAGEASLMAGVVEAYTRLAAGETPSVVLSYADVPLPDFYHGLDHEHSAGLFLALRLAPAVRAAAPPLEILPGRAGALRLLDGLRAAAEFLAVPETFTQGLAA
jgi:hypothetical protein